MKLRNIRVGVRLGLGYGLVLALIVSMLLSSVIDAVTTRNRYFRDLAVLDAKIVSSSRMRTEVLQAAIALRDLVMQTDAAALREARRRVEACRQRYAEARGELQKFPRSAPERTLLEEIDGLSLHVDGATAAAVTAALAQQAGTSANIVGDRIETAAPRLQAALHDYVELQRKAKRDFAASVEVRTGKILLMLWIVVLSIFACIFVFVNRLTRSITHPLYEASSVIWKIAHGKLGAQFEVSGKDEMSDLLHSIKAMDRSLASAVGSVCTATDNMTVAAREIAVGNADLSVRTESQAGALAQAAATMEQLTATVVRNAGHVRRANQLAASAAQAALDGGEVVQRVVQTMTSLKDGSHAIGEIIGVIDTIAFQTNILALNASVEAARAGEQGRGFAVVAAEMRNLAQRSALAAQETRELIADSVGNVDAGSALVGEAGATMDEIVGAVGRMTDIIGKIAAAGEQQSTGIHEVNQVVLQMDAMTAQNAALVEQAAAAARSMQDQGVALFDAVGRFRLKEEQVVAFVQPLQLTHG